MHDNRCRSRIYVLVIVVTSEFIFYRRIRYIEIRMNIDVANYLNDKERFTSIDIFRTLDACLTSFEILQILCVVDRYGKIKWSYQWL